MLILVCLVLPDCLVSFVLNFAYCIFRFVKSMILNSKHTVVFM